MLKKIYIVFLCFSGVFVSCQVTRTKVIVVGGGASGTGAAIQSAHSGVETLLIESGSQLGTDIGPVDSTSRLGLEKNLVSLYKKSQNLKTKTLSPALVPIVLKGWTDTVKNLKVALNTNIQSIDKSGNRWKIRLSNGNKVKAEVIVDASSQGIAAQKTGTKKTNGEFPRLAAPVIKPVDLYRSNLYRTAVVTDTLKPGITPLASFISSETENLVFAKNGSAAAPSLAMGQAAGASAAYCAFFGTTTKKINTRIVQGELMAYGMWLLPFADIPPSDPHSTAIQHIGATGILKAAVKEAKLYFMPDSTVSSEEIRPEMKAYYMRSQIWKPGEKIEKLSLDDVLSLIKICGARGDELNRDVEKNWKTGFGFSGKFDLKKPVTRRQFAVLLDVYLQPFSVRIGQGGKVNN